jgi:hypothetical protein
MDAYYMLKSGLKMAWQLRIIGMPEFLWAAGMGAFRLKREG